MASREGKPVSVTLPESVNVSGTKAITLADLKPGTPLGVTTIKRADGQLVAIDVRPIPPTACLGLSPVDLQPHLPLILPVEAGARLLSLDDSHQAM